MGIKRQIPFLITISYLLFFVLIRLFVALAGSARGLAPDEYFYIGRNVILFGYRIHHFYFGIALICYAAWVAIVHTETMDRRFAAILFGAGLGLFMDQIGMLLTGSYYSSITIWISMLLAVILLNLAFFPGFWQEFRKSIGQSTSRLAKFFLKNEYFLKVADYMGKKNTRTERLSLVFTGLIFLAVGLLILFYPRFVHYWVAGGFFIEGISSFVKAWFRGGEEGVEEI